MGYNPFPEGKKNPPSARVWVGGGAVGRGALIYTLTSLTQKDNRLRSKLLAHVPGVI